MTKLYYWARDLSNFIPPLGATPTPQNTIWFHLVPYTPTFAHTTHKKSKLRPIRVYPVLTYYYSYVSKTYGALLSLATPLHLSVPKTNLISYPLPLHIFLYNLLLFLYKNTPRSLFWVHLV